MKHRILSMLTALALCLSLLPGTARAAEGDAGPVTITDNDGQSVTLAAGKYYVINTGVGESGVTEQDNLPTDKAYLTYESGTLTVFGNGTVYIEGTMALSGDLKVARDPTAQNNAYLTLTRTGDSGPALSLNGHTLTLEKVIFFQVVSSDQPAVDGGTIRFAVQSRNNIGIQSANANAVSGDLAVENAGRVNISGVSPMFRGLDVKECDEVWISSYNDTELSSIIDKITIDRPISLKVFGKYDSDAGAPIKTEGLMMPDHTVWTDGGALASSGTHFIRDSVTTPTAYRAGEGWALYTPGDNDTPAKLTLDGASYNWTINIQQADSVQLELKGENEVKNLTANDMTLTGNGSFEGELLTGGFTNNSTGTLSAVVGVKVPDAAFYSNTVYGKYDTSDIGDFYVREHSPLTIAEGAVLTVDTKSKLILSDGPANLTNNGTIINNGVVEIHTTQSIADADISAFIKGLKLTGSGTVTVEKMVSGSGPVTETYTHSGLKLLEPPGTDGKLDLSSTDTADDSHWDTQGYKWEVTKGEDDNGDPVITNATLTLAPGFNATEVKLPDTAVTIVTQGESTIETLSPSNNPPRRRCDHRGHGGELD